MIEMEMFITLAIEEAGDVGVVEGQARYRAYFINTTRFVSKKEAVDTMLTIDGYSNCIVTE